MNTANFDCAPTSSSFERSKLLQMQALEVAYQQASEDTDSVETDLLWDVAIADGLDDEIADFTSYPSM